MQSVLSFFYFFVYSGSGCADESYPSIYERTSFFYNWAVKTVCEVSENPPEYFGCPTKQPSSQPLSIAPTQYPSSLPSDFPSITPTQLPPNGDGSYFTTLEAQYVPITNQSPTLTSNVPSNGEFQSVLDSNLSPLSLATDELQFVTWDPIEPLKHCQGDCDRDADCAGNMICFKRSGSVSVPGCADSSGYVPSVSDFCYYEAPIDGSN